MSLKDHFDKNESNLPDIYVLYIPGGGMLGILPAMMLEYLEGLTGRPSAELFQVMDGVSTGAILAGGLNVRDPENPERPKFEAAELKDFYFRYGPKIFPEMPWRGIKNVTASVANIIEDAIDPTQGSDKPVFQELKMALAEVKEKSNEKQKDLVDEIESLALKRWITKKQKSRAMELCTALSESEENPIREAEDLYELLNLRQVKKVLSKTFGKIALRGLKLTKKWADQRYYDPKVMQGILQNLMGDVRLSDSLSSLYISSYDIGKDRKVTFFSRKRDYFNNENPKQTVSTDNVKIWDAVMASAANHFAFPPHETESGIVCDDQAIVHTPLRSIHDVIDVINKRKSGQRIKLIMLDTGSYVTRKTNNEALKAEHIRHGITGRIINGRAITAISNYAMSDVKEAIVKELGKENIIEFSPRLNPRNTKEQGDFPSRANILNASEKNLNLIEETGKRFIKEQGHRLRKLAIDLVTNLHKAGKMPDQELATILDKIEQEDKKAGPPAGHSNNCPRPAEEQDNNPPGSNKNCRKGPNTGSGPC